MERLDCRAGKVTMLRPFLWALSAGILGFFVDAGAGFDGPRFSLLFFLIGGLFGWGINRYGNFGRTRYWYLRDRQLWLIFFFTSCLAIISKWRSFYRKDELALDLFGAAFVGLVAANIAALIRSYRSRRNRSKKDE